MECTYVEIADLDIFVWQDFLLKIQLRAHAPYLEISKKILGLWNVQEHLSLCQFSRCEVLFRWPAEPAAAACASIVPVSMLCENTRVTQFTKVPILAETMATYCEAGRCLFIFTPLDKQTRRQPFCFEKTHAGQLSCCCAGQQWGWAYSWQTVHSRALNGPNFI